MCMAIPIELTNRSGSNGTMAISTVMGKFFHQGLIEEKAWDALVPKVHSKIRSITNEPNLVLRGIEHETNTFVDVVTESIKINEFLRAMSTDGMSISRVTERVVQVLLMTWNLMMFPEVTFIRTSLGASTVAFMALENRDLSARIGVRLRDGDEWLRIS